MKKLVFAVIAAVAMVSVSNVFAGNKMANVASAAPVDTVAPETPEAPADTVTTPTDTLTTPTDTISPTSIAE